jgi:hypothetical protein
MKMQRKAKVRRSRRVKRPNITRGWCEGGYAGFSPTNRNAWLWLFIAIFMTGFTGNNLLDAAFTQSILNLRVVTTVYLAERPIWFVFVALLNVLMFLFCVGYIWCFLKQRVESK